MVYIGILIEYLCWFLWFFSARISIVFWAGFYFLKSPNSLESLQCTNIFITTPKMLLEIKKHLDTRVITALVCLIKIKSNNKSHTVFCMI